ncbi:acetyl-CoA carboxylase biotin carboxylase subunit [bacterium]|nr:acetyl-CoA carboxylase biotin carboxylase subunit [bacterium]
MFKKVLIANRGEIALRIIRACRELGISTVAVHSEIDEESLHVKMADESVCIGKNSSKDSYLSMHQVLSAAEITNADAIHPGYGFLAENAEFVKMCGSFGIKFIGPTAEHIELMGDKIISRDTMKKAGIPMLPSIEIDKEADEQVYKAIKKMGFPVIVKATAGGGGKGIKIVYHEKDLRNAIKTAQAEAKAAFNNPTIFIEKYLEKAKHIEFQIVSDGKNIIHLGERDCSIQRRYQKLIEEAPCAILPIKKRDEIGKTVVKALKKIGYSNVGTVEFLMDDDYNFYFLEMNTRIQVEHPVTEAITGIDLVKLQIELAYGKPLTLKQEEIKFRGHAIEMRINAEDSEKMLPSVGTISGIHIPGGPGVRVDNGVYDGFYVSPFYDSLLAKLIVRADSREECISRSKAALKEFLIEGVDTSLKLHQKILSSDAFKKCETYTKSLDNLLK